MLRTVFISVFVVACTIFTYGNSQDALVHYVVRKDILNGFKAGEFSVYNTTEKQLSYRIESKFGSLHNLRVISYPSKIRVGQLQEKSKELMYKADISILDEEKNQLINGTIEQKFQFIGSLFNIFWDDHHITMEGGAFSQINKFFDENKQVVAQFRSRLGSMFGGTKYDMQVFSNKYPNQIYILALAVRNHIFSKTG